LPEVVAPPPPPQPTRRPRQYAGGSIWLGLVAGIVATLVLPILGLLGANQVSVRGVATTLFVTGVAVPLILGIVLLARGPTPRRRGLGLGLLIGWTAAPFVFGAALVLFVVGFDISLV